MIHEIAVTGLPIRRPFARVFERAAIRTGRGLLNGTVHGSLLLTLPSGRRVRIGEKRGETEAELRLNSYTLLPRALRRGSIGFAESYISGDIDTPDLVSVFRFFVRNKDLFARAGRGFFKVRAIDRLAHLMRENSLNGARRNIAEHYDLGNDFFSVWLDDDLNYSSGLYEDALQTLEQAQAAKHDLVAAMLAPRPGDRVLEIGCGWGGMARRLAGLGAKVTGVTLSREQLAHAQGVAERLDLAGRCQFRLQDYRDVPGRFDGIVSIEMIEAVGKAYWPVYFRTLRDRLRPGGVAVVQAITIDEARFAAYSRSTDFIQRYIFPGGMLPTQAIIAREAERAGLRLEESVRFGRSYALTLREWRRRFEAGWPKIAALGFDERFRRMWRYYLTYCEAGFLDGLIDVGVYRLEKAPSPSGGSPTAPCDEGVDVPEEQLVRHDA